MKTIILAGGTGDRLWPLSRINYPKQFMQVEGRRSLFQETITRNIPLCDEFIIITHKRYESIVESQLLSFQGLTYRVFLEETRKGTLAALAVVSEQLKNNEKLLVVPSDIQVAAEGYQEAILEAKSLLKNKFVLFGVEPTRGAKSYGYIKADGKDVVEYIEKPGKQMAEKLYEGKEHFWNSGIMLCENRFLKEVIREEAPVFADDITRVSRDVEKRSASTFGVSYDLISEKERLTIEEVLYRNVSRLSVVPLNCKWVDVYNFKSYVENRKNFKDRLCIKKNAPGSTVINTTSNQLVVLNGIKDAYVVNTDDAIYITDIAESDKISEVMSEYKDRFSGHFQYNPVTYRTWGSREVLRYENGYRVRKITIYPGMSISRHMHQMRNENYTIIKGKLTVKLDNDTLSIKQGESINILPNIMHELINQTDKEVVAIEVDTGEIIVEEDNSSRERNFNMPSLYKLSPSYKDYIWGGDRLNKELGKDSPYFVTAESWELSAHKDGQSIIEGGKFDGMSFGEFVEEYQDKVCGWKSNAFKEFPILIKFIDAAKDLSIQIHPYDEYAFTNEGEFGKNEMWYVMDAKKGAFVYCGLSRETTPEELEQRISDGTVTELLNKVPVKKGDVIYVPAGTIHAIGAGILICEIQQNSNSTYRVFDYKRVDKDGNERQLHVDKALDVVDLHPYMPVLSGEVEKKTAAGNKVKQLSMCKYFETARYVIKGEEKLITSEASFMSLIFTDGAATVKCEGEILEAKRGDSIFVASGRKVVHIQGKCEILVTNI